MDTSIAQNLRGRMKELKTLRDEIRVDMHLAGMDLQDEWHRIERRLPEPNQVGAELKHVTSEAIEGILDEVRRFRRFLQARTAGQTVGALMTPRVHVCRPDTSLAEAARIMWQHDVGWLPVVEEDGRVVAVVTDRDACMAAYLAGVPLEGITVRTAMSRTVQCCRPEASLQEAEAIMSREQLRRLPVVDADGKLVGVITVGDLARAADLVGGPASGPAAGNGVTHTLAAIAAPRIKPPEQASS